MLRGFRKNNSKLGIRNCSFVFYNFTFLKKLTYAKILKNKITHASYRQ